jgi:hypothetical protein
MIDPKKKDVEPVKLSTTKQLYKKYMKISVISIGVNIVLTVALILTTIYN